MNTLRRRFCRLWIVAVILTLCPLPQSGAEEAVWELVADTVDITVYLDVSSLEVREGDRYLTLYRVIAKNPHRREFTAALREEEGLPFDSYRNYLYSESREEIDCSSGTYRTLETVDFADNAVKIGTPKTDGRWRSIPPSSPQAALARWLCDGYVDDD